MTIGVHKGDPCGSGGLIIYYIILTNIYILQFNQIKYDH
jgi:hypothetical protein